MTTPSPDDIASLRKAYKRSLELRDPTDRSECPDPDTIRGLVEAEGPESLRLATLDHVMQCSGCQREFDLFRALHEGQASTSSWIRPWMAAAASVVLLAGVGYGIWQRETVGNRVFRGPEAGIELVQPPSEEVFAGNLQFVWRSEVDAFEYILEVVNPEGQAILQRTTADTFLVLSSQDLPEQGGSVTWWVRARLRDGTETASDPRALTLPER